MLILQVQMDCSVKTRVDTRTNTTNAPRDSSTLAIGQTDGTLLVALRANTTTDVSRTAFQIGSLAAYLDDEQRSYWRGRCRSTNAARFEEEMGKH